MYAIINLSSAEVWGIIGALVFVLFDVIVGLFGAIARKEFSSTVMREGLVHKCTLIIIIILAILIQIFSAHIATLGFDMPLVLPVSIYIIVMEVGSILETVAKTYPDISNSKIMQLFNRKED